MDFQRYTRYALGLALTGVFLLHIVGMLPISFLATLENLSYDARLRLMLPGSVDKQVVIIDIDEKSLDLIGRWPWNRDVMAELVDELFDYYRVNVLGFDVVFAEKDENQASRLLQEMANGPLKDNGDFQLEYVKALNSLQHDAAFASSLRNRKTILSFVMDTDTQKGMLPEPVATLDSAFEGHIPFIKSEGYTANLEILQASAYSAGFFDNPLLDADGIYRRIPLLQEHNGMLYESFALALARTSLNSPELELIVESGPDNHQDMFLKWLKVGDIVIPVDDHAAVQIPYLGRHKSFRYISAIDVLNKTAPPEALNGKIALFGTSAPGLFDLRTTPVEAAFPGVEIHANIIQGILDQTIMHQPGYTAGYEFILLLVLGLLLTFVLPVLSPIWGLTTSITLLVLLIAGNLAAWSKLQIVLPLAAPVLLVIFMFTLQVTYGFFVETRGKRRLTSLFGQYVPPELVDEMSMKMEEINLDGEIREMSVLFSDVRSFTTLSENMEPEKLTELINGFLTPITEIIHHERGTIDKYMGDAVMAFWGAPLEDPHHALHALTAAMNMVERIKRLKPDFESRGWPEINISVAINTGDMNVGNKGSRFRVDYTVVGDAVNLASRLEGLTNTYGVDIIAGENTRHAVPEFEFRELDRVKVKGRDKPVAIYEPLGLLETIGKSERMKLKQFHLGLKYYRARRWDDAEQIIFTLNRDDPHRMVYQIYLDRIIHFRKQPPPSDWDGAYTHTSK